MAELIDKGALILHLKKIVSRESASDNASAGERRILEMVVSVILNCIEAVAEQPTTTESDIRASVIDEALKALSIFNDREHGNEHFIYGIETAKEILEQLKESE